VFNITYEKRCEMKVFLFESLKINILLQFKNKISSCVNQKCIHKWSQSFATPIPKSWNFAWDAASHSSQLCVIFILSWEINCQTRLICLDCVCAEGDGAEIFSRQGAAAGEKWPLLRETGDNTFSLCTTATRQVALKQSLPLPPRRCIVFCQSLISACKREKSWRSQCECVHLIFWSAAFIVIASARDFIRPYLSMLETVFVCKCLIHRRRLQYIQYIKVLTPFTLTLSLSPGSNLLFVKISRKRTWPYWLRSPPFIPAHFAQFLTILFLSVGVPRRKRTAARSGIGFRWMLLLGDPCTPVQILTFLQMDFQPNPLPMAKLNHAARGANRPANAICKCLHTFISKNKVSFKVPLEISCNSISVEVFIKIYTRNGIKYN
jgi:hypothetical protein